MIALLDPALFVWGVTPAPLERDDEQRLEELVANAFLACREANATLAPIAGYWDHLWREFAGPLRRRLQTPGARAALDELRKRGGSTLQTLPAPPPKTRVWGFRTLFGQSPSMMLPVWEDRMADAASRAILAGHRVMILVRLVDGRNLRVHRGKTHVVIDEVTRWRLYVLVPGPGDHVVIDCVRSPQQIRRRWTTRYDHRLPTQHDDVRYPFCLPPDWHRGSVAAVQTVASVPAWIDVAGRGWTRPDIPGGAGYHWDVFVEPPALARAIGVDQLNIVQFGAPSGEGEPGTLHHVPDKKKSKVTDLGWSCG